MPNYGLLKVSGTDAKKFLQGQLTCNLEEVSPSQSRLGAYCNPQGRVLCIFRIFQTAQDYTLVMPQEMVAHTLTFLRKYAVFFKCELHDASTDDNPTIKAIALHEWQQFDINKGVPQVYPSTIGKFLPHDLNLHELDGISWVKGCYTGQEIIARMQYRGKLKTHLYRALLQTAGHPQPGNDLYCLTDEGLKNAGIIADCHKEGYNKYQLLVVAHENDTTLSLVLNPEQNEKWEWLPLNG